MGSEPLIGSNTRGVYKTLTRAKELEMKSEIERLNAETAMIKTATEELIHELHEIETGERFECRSCGGGGATYEAPADGIPTSKNKLEFQTIYNDPKTLETIREEAENFTNGDQVDFWINECQCGSDIEYSVYLKVPLTKKETKRHIECGFVYGFYSCFECDKNGTVDWIQHARGL